MEQNAIPQQITKKVEFFFSITSWVLSVVGFSLDYPLISLFFVIIFFTVGFVYFREDFSLNIQKSETLQSPKWRFWFNSITKNRLALIFIFSGIVILFPSTKFISREIYFKFKNGWVENIKYDYQRDMPSIYLTSLEHNNRVFNILEKIQPVLHQTDVFEGEISFEALDIDTGNDFYSNQNLLINVIGYDPDNKFIKPAGNFQPNISEESFTRFPIKNKYTIFVALDDCPSHFGCYVRLHIDFDYGINGRTHTTISLSYLNNGSDRFDGLTQP